MRYKAAFAARQKQTAFTTIVAYVDIWCCAPYARSFMTREAAIEAVNHLNGASLDDRPMKVEMDKGFHEGRQYGRGGAGGQVRDELRSGYDEGRGGYSARELAEMTGQTLPGQPFNYGSNSNTPGGMMPSAKFSGNNNNNGGNSNNAIPPQMMLGNSGYGGFGGGFGYGRGGGRGGGGMRGGRHSIGGPGPDANQQQRYFNQQQGGGGFDAGRGRGRGRGGFRQSFGGPMGQSQFSSSPDGHYGGSSSGGFAGQKRRRSDGPDAYDNHGGYYGGGRGGGGRVDEFGRDLPPTSSSVGASGGGGSRGEEEAEESRARAREGRRGQQEEEDGNMGGGDYLPAAGDVSGMVDAPSASAGGDDGDFGRDRRRRDRSPAGHDGDGDDLLFDSRKGKGASSDLDEEDLMAGERKRRRRGSE